MSVEATPTVSVVVPVRDDAERLRRCLDAIGRQTLAPLEVIVVDDGSRDDPGPVCRASPGVRLLRRPADGSYAARNRGIEVAAGRVVAFTDADCLPRPGWLEAGAAALSDPDVGLVGGRIVVAPLSARPSGVELYQALEAFPQSRYVEERGFAVTANLFARRSVLTGVGMFREDLRSGGDLDLGRRARAAGHTVAYAHDAVVEHPPRSTWRALARKQVRVLEGLAELGDEPARSLVRLAAPPVRKLLRALTDPRLHGPGQRLRYAAVALGVHYLGLLYRLTGADRYRSSRPEGSEEVR